MRNTTPNRFATREAAESMFFTVDESNKEHAFLTLKTLKMTEIQNTSATVYAQGGRGNPKIVGFSGDKENSVTLQDAIFDMKSLAMLTGNEVSEDLKDIYRQEELTVSLGTVTVDKEIVDVITVEALDIFGYPVETVEVAAFDGKEITLTGIDDGTEVKVSYTTFIAAGKNKTIKVTADKFPGIFKLVVDVLVKDENNGKLYAGQFIAPRVQIEEDWSFNFSPTGDPSVLDIPIQILKAPRGYDMYEMVLYDVDDLGVDD